MVVKGEVIALEGWASGVNLSSHASRLEAEELAEATNVIIGQRGEIKQRPGLEATSVYATEPTYEIGRIVPFASDEILVGGDPVSSGFFVYDADLSEVNFVGDGGINGFKTASIDTGTALGRDFTVVVMNGLAYLSSTLAAYEVDPDGMTPTELTEWDLGTTVTTEYPTTPIVIQAYERLFAADPYYPTPVERYRLFFSEPLLPKSWNTTNYIDINPDDGQAITGLAHFADQLLIFKERSIWGISGKDFTSLDGVELYQIDGSIGSSLRRTMVNAGALLFFVDPRQGIFAYDGSVFHNIGEPIWDYLSENWQELWLSDAVGFLFDGRYHLTMSMSDSGGEPNKTFVYDILRGAWTIWDRGFSDAAPLLINDSGNFLPDIDRLVVVRADDSSGQQFVGARTLTDEALTDAGSDIDISIKTGWLSPSGGFARHRIAQTIIQMTTSQDPVTVDLHIDYDTTSPAATLTMDPSTAEEDGAAWRTHAFNSFRWRHARLSVTVSVTSSATEPFQLNSLRLMASALESARGESVVAP